MIRKSLEQHLQNNGLVISRFPNYYKDNPHERLNFATVCLPVKIENNQLDTET